MKNSKITPEMRHDVLMALDYERYLDGNPYGVDMAELNEWLAQWGGNPDVKLIYQKFRDAVELSKQEQVPSGNKRRKGQLRRARRNERKQLKMQLEFQSKYDNLKAIHASKANLILLAKSYRKRGLTQENVRSVMKVSRRQLEHMGLTNHG